MGNFASHLTSRTDENVPQSPKKYAKNTKGSPRMANRQQLFEGPVRHLAATQRSNFPIISPRWNLNDRDTTTSDVMVSPRRRNRNQVLAKVLSISEMLKSALSSLDDGANEKEVVPVLSGVSEFSYQMLSELVSIAEQATDEYPQPLVETASFAKRLVRLISYRCYLEAKTAEPFLTWVRPRLFEAMLALDSCVECIRRLGSS
mmetsp:Transcript_10433/g.17058  ORF Transcript_10433/g.17058 Transcript_10433/m.17058 type:complete len:203 (-) Transcript_10433:372-980(-)